MPSGACPLQSEKAKGYFTTRQGGCDCALCDLGRRRGGLFVRVVAGADQRAGFDVAEAHGEGFALEVGEFLRRVKTGHGEMVAGGTKILADGEDVAAGVGEVAEDFEEFAGL